MGIHRNYTWKDVSELDAHLAAFLNLDEALERFLGEFGSVSHDPYKILTDSGSVDRTSRAQISDAVDSLGGSLRGLEVWYRSLDGGCRVNLSVQPFPGFPEYRIGCSLQVFGDDENETNGRFDTLRNRMDAEIKRQWPESGAAKREIEPATKPEVPSSATPPRVSGFKQRAGETLRHPIVAPLVVVGVITLIGALWKVYLG